MFNLGFFEILIFGVIALIVLGPDKLIYTAKTLGKWYGQFRNITAKLQQDFASEFELNQLQQQFETEIAKIRASEQDLKNQLNQLQNNLQNESNKTINSIKLTDDDKHQKAPLPLSGRFFLLGDYDKKRRLPDAPFLPNYKADKLLYQSTNIS